MSLQTYSLTGPSGATVLHHALAILKPHLPVCLPLYRRLQFGRFVDATSLITNVAPGSSPRRGGSVAEDEPWLFAFVDRSCRPETEVWFFGSWEVQESPPAESQRAIDELIKGAVAAMKGLGLPTSMHQDILDAAAQTEQLEDGKDSGGYSRADYGGHLRDPNTMLWGGTHEKSVRILQRLELLNMNFKTGLAPNHTFIWNVDALPEPKELPSGLHWGQLQSSHFALVRSRTQIPRQDRTLAVLPNLAIYADGSDSPISWAFVGLDASLTTLHVEPQWRGKGLAKALTTKLFKEKMGHFWEETVTRFAYGYVIVGNQQSEGMCRSLGGKSKWETYWLRVDLSTV